MPNAALKGLKRVNYFYGKNGTGKSSLVRALVKQYGNDYNIQVFSDRNPVIMKDEALDAISLGQENTEAIKAIANYDKQIAELDKDLKCPESTDKETLNLYQQQKLAAQRKQELITKRNHFYQQAARELKNQHTSLTGPNYNKNDFEKDISYSQQLTEKELTTTNETLSAQILDLSKVTPPALPVLQDLSKLKAAVDDILSASVQSRVVMEEFVNQPNRQNFAYEGMKIHDRGSDERCAFCGNPISKDRWDQLDRYFSNEVESLKKRISKGLSMIANVHQHVEEVFEFSQTNWHLKYQSKQSDLQMAINEHRKIIVGFLNQLRQALNNKKDVPFKKISPLVVEVPEDFKDLQKSLTNLWQENTTYNQQLIDKKKTAAIKMRRHYVYQRLIVQNHDKLLKDLETAIKEDKFLEDKINRMKSSKNQLKRLKANAISKTSSEARAAKEINRLVLNLGDESFSLQPIKRLNQPKGLYQIVGRDNKPRSLKTLSTGEINLLAFLWFRYHLDDVNDTDTRPRVIVFDDPVNSNDDNSQYLILAEIQELIANDQADQFLIFTHNNHFYVQIRPSSYKNKGMFHLRRAGKTSIIQITSPKNDLSSIYEDLWDELHFLYNNKRIISTWNCMRRILETYGRFNFANDSPRKTEYNLPTSTDRILYLSLLKSLHVNSHIGIDTDIDLSGRNIETLLYAFYDVFASLKATDHFRAYWGGGSTRERCPIIMHTR